MRIWPFGGGKKEQRRSRRLPQRRSYAMAAATRLTSGWTTAATSADHEVSSALVAARARARELARNDAYAVRFLNLLKTNVVGHAGIKLQVRAKDSNGQLDTWANDQLESGWKAWGKKKNCTAAGTRSWVDVQQLVLTTLARDGEVLVRKLPRWDGNRFLFALHVLEADLLDENLNLTLDNGNKIVMGVEKNKWGRPLAYWLLENHPGDTAGVARQQRIRIPAAELEHLFIAERPGQTRGISWFVPAGARVKMLDGYEEAELVAARTAASKMGFFISPDGEGYTGDDFEEDSDQSAPITEAEPGTFEQLPTGMDFKSWDPEHPVTAFADFEKAILRGIASGLNVSYVALANNLEGVSYSSIRSGEMADRDAWRLLQNFLVEHLCEPVWEEWLTWFLTSGLTKLPLNRYDKFNAPVWRPRGWAWVDPRNESEAAANDVEQGFKALDAVAAERGYDLEEIFEANARARDLAKKYGLTIPSLSGKEEDNGNGNQTE